MGESILLRHSIDCHLFMYSFIHSRNTLWHYCSYAVLGMETIVMELKIMVKGGS